jgi:hypothetical protein
MKHFKRRCSDAQQIVKELFDLVTWTNFILVVPGIILFTPILVFLLLFEDYDENDRWEKEITEYLNTEKNEFVRTRNRR